ncbi:hypothetical protein HK104_003858 [Borealophlyctis nickersoniae]|nr:hypothetical protein HK104_003858 [Borealophlyctis nickersoniae]
MSAITAAVRATNPLLDELLHSLQLLEANDEGLTELDLTDCPVFTVQHGTALAKALLYNTELKVLVLKGCRIQTQNATEIAEALRHNTTLETLNLDNNQIAPAGIKAIAEMLDVNEGLKEVRLSQQRQQAGTDAEQALAKALLKNQTLTKLSLQLRDPASRNAVDRYITRNKEIGTFIFLFSHYFLSLRSVKPSPSLQQGKNAWQPPQQRTNTRIAAYRIVVQLNWEEMMK